MPETGASVNGGKLPPPRGNGEGVASISPLPHYSTSNPKRLSPFRFPFILVRNAR
uniref:Uncharacterized protein n=1 Tax=Candidatus Kentrum sp. TC TaxID=2126339 RepID=A0A450Z2J6_9GAMM|nr:MAG: hypothetical protein BECKTC1821D_GA0114238_105610 [Candidatus Kentron sp. TC]